MELRKALAIGVTAVLLACQGAKGDQGEQGPQGAQGPAGAPGTTTFGGLTDVPPALLLPIPAGASAAIVSSITVTASADCGAIAPTPRLEVYVDGQFLAGTDVTQSTYADTSPFPVNPPRYVHEVAVAFPNDSQAGGCDHNLRVQQVKLTTAAGEIVIPATRTAHVIYDKGGFFDNRDVAPATSDIGVNGALRFFLSHTSTVQARVSTPIATGGGLPRTGNFSSSGGTLLILASASGYVGTGSGTLQVNVSIDGVVRTSILGYTNEPGSHKALPGISYVLTGLPPGPHTVTLSAAGPTLADTNDYSHVTIVELPL